MFFVLGKRQIVLILLLIAVISAAVFTSFMQKDENTDICLRYLESIGYSSEESPYEVAEVTIPEGFGTVYENYNALQKKAGFDLTPYRGMTLLRYSFRLYDKNYTIANFLISDGKICGGDILNPSIGGNMLPLTGADYET